MSIETLINQALTEAEETDINYYVGLLSQTNRRKYVVGKNAQSAELIGKFKIDGVIDDYNQQVNNWKGIPVIRTSDITLDSIVINCTSSISPVLVNDNLKAAGLKSIININEIISNDGWILSLPWFVRGQREEIQKHLDWWSAFYDHLADDQSKKTLSDVVRFRLTANPQYLIDYSIRVQDQYLENFMGYKQEVFVDAGGYDGDTTEEFIKRYPDYRKVYLFEPSEKNLAAAKHRLHGRRDIDFRSVGLSDSEGMLHFDADAGSASAVSIDSGEAISVVTLDKELTGEPVSFIKMDLEGWEMNALRGATEIIRKNRPKLAMAVYHTAKDFREIPEYALGVHSDYRVYLRHYTQGWSETVMFFL